MENKILNILQIDQSVIAIVAPERASWFHIDE